MHQHHMYRNGKQLRSSMMASAVSEARRARAARRGGALSLSLVGLNSGPVKSMGDAEPWRNRLRRESTAGHSSATRFASPFKGSRVCAGSPGRHYQWTCRGRLRHDNVLNCSTRGAARNTVLFGSSQCLSRSVATRAAAAQRTRAPCPAAPTARSRALLRTGRRRGQQAHALDPLEREERGSGGGPCWVTRRGPRPRKSAATPSSCRTIEESTPRMDVCRRTPRAAGGSSARRPASTRACGGQWGRPCAWLGQVDGSTHSNTSSVAALRSQCDGIVCHEVKADAGKEERAPTPEDWGGRTLRDVATESGAGSGYSSCGMPGSGQARMCADPAQHTASAVPLGSAAKPHMCVSSSKCVCTRARPGNDSTRSSGSFRLPSNEAGATLTWGGGHDSQFAPWVIW